MNLILPESMDAPTIPEYFLRGLRDLDQSLVIYWNRFKQRFVIDRCTNDAPHTHGPHCERSNVLIVEDPEHGFLMPNDGVLSRIRSMDAWTQYGGKDEAAMLRRRKERENAKAEWDAKQHQAARDGYRDQMADNRKQILDAITLIQRHDVARPHK